MKKVSLFLKLFVTVSLACLITVTADAATLEVGEGKTYASIQAAISAAVAGDTVLVYNGTYMENINFLGKMITVRSVNGAASTIIDGNASGSVVTFGTTFLWAVLDGFTITNGSSENGGGIYCYGSNAIITNCIISGNSAEGGGGIYVQNSNWIDITNCTITANTASQFGGGIYCDGSYATITNCTITANSAQNGDGGGIYCSSSDPTITNCTISGNSAQNGGGIAWSFCYPITVTNCTITGNTAASLGFGGGFGGSPLSDSGSATITNCTITGNTAGLGGGGAALVPVTITNCTITGNTASGSGGALFLRDDLTIKNSIMWGNSAWLENEIDSSPNNTYITYSNVNQEGYAGSNGNIRQDPLFVDPANDDFRLQRDSPCIDAATSDAAPPRDMVDNPRFDAPWIPNTGGGTSPYYDMGALEFVKHAVLQPNGGEVMPSGSPYTIKWAAPSNMVSFKLQYSMDNGTTWKSIASGVSGRSHDWTVPVPGNNERKCLVKVVGYNASGLKMGADKSDAPFTIEVIKLTSPNGGQPFASGESYPIQWTTYGTKKQVAKVVLMYTKDNGVTWSKIIALPENPGSHSWTVPDVKNLKKNCRVKVLLKDATGNTLGTDVSDEVFTIIGSKVLLKVIGNSTIPIPRSDACGNSAGRICESLVGDLTADSMRETYNTDFAITNSGGLRADLTCPTTDIPGDFCPAYTPPPYPMTRGQVLTVLPFGNAVFTVTIDGAELKTYLENGVSTMPAANGRFPQVSGLCFTYDISAPVGSRVLSAVRQAEDGSCTGAPVDLTAASTYTIAENDFMAAGGDGYPNVYSRGATWNLMDQVLADYIADNTPVDPAIQGRITCTTSGATTCPVVTP